MWIALNFEESSIIQFILFKGSPKFSLQGLIVSPASIQVKILAIFFDSETKPGTFNVAQPLFKNFIKIPEEKLQNLQNFWPLYWKRNSSNKIEDHKHDERNYKFFSFFLGLNVMRLIKWLPNCMFCLCYFFCEFRENLKIYIKLIDIWTLKFFLRIRTSMWRVLQD